MGQGPTVPFAQALAFAVDMARQTHAEVEHWWSVRDRAQEAALTLCSREKTEAVDLIKNHNGEVRKLD